MEFNVTPILEAVLALCMAVLTAVVIPWFRARYGNATLNELLAWVDVGVAAAEQLYESTDGDKKKAYVLEFLAGKGYRIDEDEIDKAIEAAVLHLHNALHEASV
jgi:hypothetical protein